MVSNSEIDLSWAASTDPDSPVSYQVWRCQGAGCSNFTQVGTPSGTSYKDTGLTASTSYTYEIRATDPSGNLSQYSGTASATTLPPPTRPRRRQPGTPTPTVVSNSEIDLSWAASTDPDSPVSYQVWRCQGAGCSNFTQIAHAHRHQPTTTPALPPPRATPTKSAPPTPPATSASTRAPPAPRLRPHRRVWWRRTRSMRGRGRPSPTLSGNGNNGTITNATWSTSGKYGGALQFNGTSALVTIPDAASLHLSSGMTLEAWVNPSTVNANWRDVIYKGNDNYYLSATSTNASLPDAGMIAGGTYADAFGTSALPANTWSFLDRDL